MGNNRSKFDSAVKGQSGKNFNRTFDKAAHGEIAKKTPFAYAFNQLTREIRDLTAHGENINDLEPQMRGAFQKFLSDLDLPLAQKNFEALLREKSGDKFKRNDGTVNWYHEFLPILQMLELGQRGRKKGGFDIADLEPYGGLDVLLSTHLRHDSEEDFKSNLAMITEQQSFVDDIFKDGKDRDYAKLDRQALQILINITLISQKRVIQPDGTRGKEDVLQYSSRMVYSEDANPIVFMCKQADICNNFATMLGAPKFDAEKRHNRCNAREDMYGPRYGFADAAMNKWPKFANAINSLDSMMGFMLYPHFRYLESVDLYDKKPSDLPIGIVYRYLPRVTYVNLPKAVHPAHIFLGRMMTSVSPHEEPEKFERLKKFILDVIRPTLMPKKETFPYLTDGQPIMLQSPKPSPIAFKP